jgi:hypothetical protein
VVGAELLWESGPRKDACWRLRGRNHRGLDCTTDSPSCCEDAEDCAEECIVACKADIEPFCLMIVRSYIVSVAPYFN